MAVSAYGSYASTEMKTCATTGAGSLTLCAEKNVTVLGSALVVNGVDVLAELAALKAALKGCGVAGSGRRLTTGCLRDGEPGAASGVLAGMLLALILTATAVA